MQFFFKNGGWSAEAVLLCVGIQSHGIQNLGIQNLGIQIWGLKGIVPCASRGFKLVIGRLVRR